MHFVYVICSFLTNELFDGWRAVIINNPIIMILTNQRFQLNVTTHLVENNRKLSCQ